MSNVDSLLLSRVSDEPDRVGSGIPGQKIVWAKLKINGMVLIKSNEVSILATVVEITDKTITGKIQGFESYLGEDVDGIGLGDTVKFSESKVHCIFG